MSNDVGSNTSDYTEAELQIKFGFTPDEKSDKAVKKSFTAMTSLVKDLAVISKIAAMELGKIWNLGEKTIKIGAEQGVLGAQASVLGVDPETNRQIREAMQASGAGAANTNKVLGELDKFTRAFQNPESQYGATFIKKFEEWMSRYNVSDDLVDQLRGQFEMGDQKGALDALTQIIDATGDEANNLMDAMGLSSLGILENADAMKQWQDVMLGDKGIYQADDTALMDANASIAQLETSILYVANLLTAKLAPKLGEFADWFEAFVQSEPDTMFQQLWDKIYEHLIPDWSIMGMIRDREVNSGVGDKIMDLVDSTKPLTNFMGAQDKWLETLNKNIGTSFASIDDYRYALGESKHSQTGIFDNEETIQKLQLVIDNRMLIGDKNYVLDPGARQQLIEDHNL